MIEEVKVLIARCEGCQTFLHDDAYNIYFPDEEALVEAVKDQDWASDKGCHWCPTCECAKTGHRLVSFAAQGYRTCECGTSYEKAIVVRDRLARV